VAWRELWGVALCTSQLLLLVAVFSRRVQAGEGVILLARIIDAFADGKLPCVRTRVCAL